MNTHSRNTSKMKTKLTPVPNTSAYFRENVTILVSFHNFYEFMKIRKNEELNEF